MTRSLRSGFGSALLMFAVCLLLVGCGGGGADNPKVTKENAEKIKLGMTEKEVKDVLGEPAETNTPPQPPGAKQLVFKNGNNVISVVILEGKVANHQAVFATPK